MPRFSFPSLLVVPLAAVGLLIPASGFTVPARAQDAARQVVPAFDEAGRRLLTDLQGAGQLFAAQALASWITASRNDAVAAGVEPIPPAIRARLRGHMPDALLDRVRYRVGQGHEFSLQTNTFNRSNAAAITLDDVVLFRSAEDAASDVGLWAHELHHVHQYRQWGVQGFAQRYTREYQGVEAEAHAGADRVVAAMRTAGTATPTPAR
ncbi:hypothetical protein M2333_003200 [Sphingobium sp. B11D3B]|uniref:DUF4157 domain-containing protein n=1 Tax=Sphingobium sp. B11D3B TaxID=2940575 RepID=UPI0022270D05|nr:DUF4157 domain-containing protein [Sphingobium sp. B11D3B]MCW2390154.1 hypothetical protein [Sphingobium sp. B11D3B]